MIIVFEDFFDMCDMCDMCDLSMIVYHNIIIFIYQWEIACNCHGTTFHIDDSVTPHYRQVNILFRSDVVHDSIENDYATTISFVFDIIYYFKYLT